MREETSDHRLALLTDNVCGLLSERVVWCIDSGCFDFYVSTNMYFSDYGKLKILKKNCRQNGKRLEAVGVGRIKTYVFIKGFKILDSIKNVCLVPEV